MNGTNPRIVRLFFAILDGSDPKTWKLYGEKFPDFMRECCKTAQPDDISTALRQKYRVEVEPIYSGPEALLREKALEDVVGVIIDAFPKAEQQTDYDQKVELLRSHVQSLQRQNRDNDDALFNRFSYSVWFMTDKTAKISTFIDHTLDAAAAIIGVKRIEHQVFKDKDWLGRHLTSYLQNVYFRLARE